MEHSGWGAAGNRVNLANQYGQGAQSGVESPLRPFFALPLQYYSLVKPARPPRPVLNPVDRDSESPPVRWERDLVPLEPRLELLEPLSQVVLGVHLPTL